MAAAEGRFFIEDKLKETAPHHASFKALWETKWQKPVSAGSTSQAAGIPLSTLRNDSSIPQR